MSQKLVSDTTRQIPRLTGLQLVARRGPASPPNPTSPKVGKAGSAIPSVDPVETMVRQLRDPARLARLQQGRTSSRQFDAQYWACWAVTAAGLLTAGYLALVA